jgi:diacylglycerol kinase (ATP)
MAEPASILLNTRAGLLHPTAGAEELQRIAHELGVDASVVAVRSPGEMRAKIRQLVTAGAERVAVAGGDGTVALAVQELAHTDTALAIIPQGTANNFATALRLSQDLLSALRVLQDGVVQEVGLGKIGDRYFTESAGVGLFADALAFYGRGSNKNLFRSLYALAGIVCSLRAHRIRLTTDGQSCEQRAVLCMAANTYRIWLALPVAPGARLTDEELDVVLIGDLRRNELLPYYRAIRSQLHAKLPKVRMLRAREIRIETRRPLNVYCDDQVVGKTPITITSHPRALKVLVEPL